MAQYWLSNPWSGDPWASLDQLHRGLDELLGRSGTRPARRAGGFPPVNLYESPDAYVLSAELPGLRSEDIEVQIEGNRVSLRGERSIEHPEDASVHRAERRAGGFRRTIELPVDVDADKAEAAHRHGVLLLRVPKSEAHQPRRVAVQSS